MSGKLYPMGFRSRIARSTLADANETHDWRIFADLAQHLIGVARPLYAGDALGVDLEPCLGRGRDGHRCPPPRTDPYERNYRIRLLSRMNGVKTYSGIRMENMRHLLPFPRCLAHTRQPLGHAYLALCRARVESMSVLLDQRPSLLTLRRRFPAFVRMTHRYYGAVRLLGNVHARRGAFAFSRWPDD
jgi:hypothetical protein